MRLIKIIGDWFENRIQLAPAVKETMEHPVRRVLAREEIYRQFDPNTIPDLFVTNNDGYRVSWQTSLGGIPKQLIEPNKQVWSGDHCSVDPEIVKDSEQDDLDAITLSYTMYEVRQPQAP